MLTDHFDFLYMNITDEKTFVNKDLAIKDLELIVRA